MITLSTTQKQSELITMVSSIILLGFIFSTLFHYIMGVYFKLPYPYSTFLFSPDDVFNDFKNMYYITKDFSPYASKHWFSSIYFPIANVLFWIFSLTKNINTSLFLFISLFCSLYWIGISIISKKVLKFSFIQNISIFFVSYPMLFALDRANIEIYVFLFVALFTYYYFVKENYILAAIFLGIAISMKLYPGVFLIFFLRDKKFKESLLLLFVCILITIIPLLLFNGGFFTNLNQMLANMRSFSATYNGIAGLQHNNTLYGLLCISIYGFAVVFGGISFSELTSFNLDRILIKPYSIFVIILFILITVFIIKSRMRDQLAYLMLTLVMILFSNISYDYKLIFLIPALVFYIKQCDSQETKKKSNVIIILVSLLLIPKDYIVLVGDVTSNVLINTIIIIILLFLIGSMTIEDNIKCNNPERVIK